MIWTSREVPRQERRERRPAGSNRSEALSTADRLVYNLVYQSKQASKQACMPIICLNVCEITLTAPVFRVNQRHVWRRKKRGRRESILLRHRVSLTSQPVLLLQRGQGGKGAPLFLHAFCPSHSLASFAILQLLRELVCRLETLVKHILDCFGAIQDLQIVFLCIIFVVVVILVVLHP